MVFYIERELRDRGVRNISRDDIFEIMPEVSKADSKTHYGSQTESRSSSDTSSLKCNTSASFTACLTILPIYERYGGRDASSEVISRVRRRMYAIGDSATLVSPRTPLPKSATPLAGSALRAGHPVPPIGCADGNPSPGF